VSPNNPRVDLTGKTALITGAVGLLAKQHAAALLECGATVVLTDVDGTDFHKAIEGLGKYAEPARVRCCSMDVTQPSAIRMTEEHLRLEGIRIDILINNAAIDPKVDAMHEIVESSRIEDFEIAQWNPQLAVGLTGAFLCSQVFGAAISQDGQGGVILNIASDLTVLSPDQRLCRNDGLPDNLQPVKNY